MSKIGVQGQDGLIFQKTVKLTYRVSPQFPVTWTQERMKPKLDVGQVVLDRLSIDADLCQQVEDFYSKPGAPNRDEPLPPKPPMALFLFKYSYLKMSIESVTQALQDLQGLPREHETNDEVISAARSILDTIYIMTPAQLNRVAAGVAARVMLDHDPHAYLEGDV